jgi:hypothetical protein
MLRGATFDPTGAYRYHLWREWDAARPAVTFIMLNPSSADAGRDDPTIRRCIGFARSWGYGRLEVVNLFAYRASSPRELFAASDPVGPVNEAYLARAAGDIVVAWGNHGTNAAERASEVAAAEDARCLGLTALGQPRHPLYVAATVTPVRYDAAGFERRG